jgi:hypothetical protein
MEKGIAIGGKTLTEMLDASERLYKETGYYYGLHRMSLLLQHEKLRG